MILTPNQYIALAVTSYLSLYSANSLKELRMKIADQLFNVIGNGIRDHEELLEAITVNDDIVIPELQERYFDGTVFYQGYTKLDEKIKKLGFDFPIFDSQVAGYYTEEEKKDHPEVVCWSECKKFDINLYPNFKEKYSIVYQSDKFKELGQEWIDFAIEYYEFAKEWMNNNSHKYHGGWPDNEKDHQILS